MAMLYALPSWSKRKCILVGVRNGVPSVSWIEMNFPALIDIRAAIKMLLWGKGVVCTAGNILFSERGPHECRSRHPRNLSLLREGTDILQKKTSPGTGAQKSIHAEM